jgi:hypothetical protein
VPWPRAPALTACPHLLGDNTPALAVAAAATPVGYDCAQDLWLAALSLASVEFRRSAVFPEVCFYASPGGEVHLAASCGMLVLTTHPLCVPHLRVCPLLLHWPVAHSVHTRCCLVVNVAMWPQGHVCACTCVPMCVGADVLALTCRLRNCGTCVARSVLPLDSQYVVWGSRRDILCGALQSLLEQLCCVALGTIVEVPARVLQPASCCCVCTHLYLVHMLFPSVTE